MKPDDLAEGLSAIFAHSPVFKDKSLIIDVIANPKAGGFSRIHHSKRRFNELKEMVKRSLSLPERRSPFSLKAEIHTTSS